MLCLISEWNYFSRRLCTSIYEIRCGYNLQRAIRGNDLETILIVDDEKLIRDLLSRFFRSKGYRTVTAKDGVEGVEMAKSVIPDVIFMDILMPRMNGNAAAHLIRRHEQLRNVPIIYLTATYGEKEYEFLRDDPKDIILGKPFDFNVLSKILSVILTPSETVMNA